MVEQQPWFGVRMVVHFDQKPPAESQPLESFLYGFEWLMGRPLKFEKGGDATHKMDRLLGKSPCWAANASPQLFGSFVFCYV